MQRGTERRIKLEDELAKEKWQIEHDGKVGYDRLQHAYMTRRLYVYKQASDLARNHAIRNGYAGVFLANQGELDPTRIRNNEHLNALIATRPCLYHEEGADITAEVIEQMNE